MANKNLTNAKKAKKDEFYTQLTDIEKELKHYKEQFKDKIVYCNCDDPEESEFWKFFELNFEEYGLKKLISTHYDAEQPTYKLELTGDRNGDGKVTNKDIVKTPLKQNGDFRSEESIALLKEADIVVTNPPWSLLNEYIGQLLEYKKDFLILGNQNACTYSNVFPAIIENKIRLGISTNGSNRWFAVPNTYTPKPNAAGYKVENGIGYLFVNSVTWFTTLNQKNYISDLIMVKDFDETKYPVYDGTAFFHIDKVANLPKNKEIKISIPSNLELWKQTYGGDLQIVGDKCLIKRPIYGVPITFLYKYNPKQFDLLGTMIHGNKKYDLKEPRVNNKKIYARYLIRQTN